MPTHLTGPAGRSNSPESLLTGRAASPMFPYNPVSSALEYFTDAFQRSVLFWDVMRKRGNQAIEHVEAGEPPVLSFRNEVVIDGRTLERPCNYMLLRILPNPESGVRIDPAKRPFVVVDPRAASSRTARSAMPWRRAIPATS